GGTGSLLDRVDELVSDESIARPVARTVLPTGEMDVGADGEGPRVQHLRCLLRPAARVAANAAQVGTCGSLDSAPDRRGHRITSSDVRAHPRGSGPCRIRGGKRGPC